MPECLIFDLFGTLVEYEAGRTSQDFSLCYQQAAELGCTIGYAEFIRVWDSAFRETEQQVAPESGDKVINVCTRAYGLIIH